MSYLVLARKWRPQTFEDVVGQQVATRALANALGSGRIAHAFLFTGARGVGKTTAARILAKSLNCQNGPTATPCNACTLCEEITAGRSVDVLEIDGASNTGVDDVRELREKVKYLPARARYKVLIIDEVHMLSGSAFNALLKTLEEPPAHVVFIFATTEPHKIPVTVLSRVQRYDFRRIAHAQVVERLATICRAEGVEAEEEALSLVAREAEGSMRDALSLLDQAWAASSNGRLEEVQVAEALGVVDRTTLFGVARALLQRDGAACLGHIETVFTRGHDMRQFAGALLNLLRDLAVVKVSTERAFFDRPDHEIAQMRGLVEVHDAAVLYRQFDTLAKAFDEVARSSYPKLLLEMTLLRMSLAEPLVPLAEAVAKLDAIERRLGGGRIDGPRAEAPLVATAGPSRSSEPRASLSPAAAARAAVDSPGSAPSMATGSSPGAAEVAVSVLPVGTVPPGAISSEAGRSGAVPLGVGATSLTPLTSPTSLAAVVAAPPVERAAVRPAPVANPEVGPTARLGSAAPARAFGASAPVPATSAVPPAPVSPAPVSPAPVFPAPVSPAPAVPPTDLGEPREAWLRVLDRLRVKRRTLAAFLEEGRLVRFTSAELEVGFTGSFELETARERETQDSLLAVIHEVLGVTPRLFLTALDASAGNLPPSMSEERRETSVAEEQRLRRALSEHPHVVAAQEILGAKLLEVRLQGEAK